MIPLLFILFMKYFPKRQPIFTFLGDSFGIYLPVSKIHCYFLFFKFRHDLWSSFRGRWELNSFAILYHVTYAPFHFLILLIYEIIMSVEQHTAFSLLWLCKYYSYQCHYILWFLLLSHFVFCGVILAFHLSAFYLCIINLAPIFLWLYNLLLIH